jgi:hypothetical protein
LLIRKRLQLGHERREEVPALHEFAKANMSRIKVRGAILCETNEELAAVRVRAAIAHRKRSKPMRYHPERFIFESWSVDTFLTFTIVTVECVTPLQALCSYTQETRPFIRHSALVLLVADQGSCAELLEVFTRARQNVACEFENEPVNRAIGF